MRLLFRLFETIQMINTPYSEEIRKYETSLTSFKYAQVLVEAGHPKGWGQVMDIIPKFDKFGLGFIPEKQSEAPKASNLFTLVKFSSSGFAQNGCTNATVDEDCVYSIDDLYSSKCSRSEAEQLDFRGYHTGYNC